MANRSGICSHPLEEEISKKVKTTKSVFTEDLISRLPDEILAYILSFIPTKTAVATCVLSKRWIRIWISVPNLDFGLYCLSTANSPVKQALFHDFVDRVLSLNNVLSVRRVDLSRTYIDCELSRLTAWISSLFRRDAVEIVIKLPKSCFIENCEASSLFYSVPDCFFNQNNLVELTLVHVVMKVPSSVWFPKIKTISFATVRLSDEDSMKNLLSGCPVLTSLTMHWVIFDNAKTLYFCSSTLNYLKLILGYCGKDFGYDIVIDAPNLIHLDLMDDVWMNYNAINIPSLVEVNFDGSVTGMGKRLFHLLRQISHVKELVLTDYIMRSFSVVSIEYMPMFHKLTKLKVELCGNDDWSILPHLLHCTPNLVTLILDMEYVHPSCAWYENETLDVPQCYSSSIEFVEISCFQEYEKEMGIIFYILKNAMVLKKLSIITIQDLDEEITDILRSLLILRTTSSECLIELKNE